VKDKGFAEAKTTKNDGDILAAVRHLPTILERGRLWKRPFGRIEEYKVLH